MRLVITTMLLAWLPNLCAGEYVRPFELFGPCCTGKPYDLTFADELECSSSAPLAQYEPYCKITFAEALINYLDFKELRPWDGNSGRIRNYTWAPGTHDRTLRAGRAAWALEQMFKIKLQPVTSTTTKSELDQIKADARNQIDAYRSGIDDVLRRAPSTEVLSHKYSAIFKAAFPPNGREARERAGEAAVLAMVGLFREWFPVGKKLRDLEQIVGVPTKDYFGTGMYGFFLGPNGFAIVLVVEDGVIRGVFFSGGCM